MERSVERDDDDIVSTPAAAAAALVGAGWRKEREREIIIETNERGSCGCLLSLVN